MRSVNSISRPNSPMVPSRMATPPPRFDLVDGDTRIGWIDGLSLGFRGFGDEGEAAGAASVAYRTMARRFARKLGRRPPPIASGVMLSIGRNGEVEHILADGRPIATLLRPGIDSRSGPEHFGFAMQVPVPASELTMRSTAHVVYRALRRSGIRWAMWAPPRGDDSMSEPSTKEEPMIMKATHERTNDARTPHAGLPSAAAFVTRVILIALAAVVGVVFLVAAPRTVTIPLAVVLLAGLVASGFANTARRRAVGERRRSATPSPGVTARGGPPAPNDVRTVDRVGESSITSPWGAIVALSAGFLVLALVARNPTGAVLTAIGLAGLLASRVAASLNGWLPRGPSPTRRIR